jgi:hypothetical protein
MEEEEETLGGARWGDGRRSLYQTKSSENGFQPPLNFCVIPTSDFFFGLFAAGRPRCLRYGVVF